MGIFAYIHLIILALKSGPRFSKFEETLFNQQGSDNFTEISVKRIKLQNLISTVTVSIRINGN